MSHRKASKRRRETVEDDEYSAFVTPIKGRSKQFKDGNETSPRQLAAYADGIASRSSVRRSSRTPKPKIFEDEETFVITRTPETTKLSPSEFVTPRESSLSLSSPISPSNDRLNSQKQRKTYDEGNKRETRRSYLDYLKELTTGSNGGKQEDDKFERDAQTSNKTDEKSRDKDSSRVNSAKRKAKLVNEDLKATPREAVLKTVTERGPSNEGARRETPDEASPKVRTSSRTPIPKRVFSLLESEGSQEMKSEVVISREVELKSKSSSKLHLPKNSPHLLEKDNASERASPKLKASKLQENKKGTYTKEEEILKQKAVRTPTVSEDSSPKIRVSSRGHVPKRNFSLLEGKEESEENKMEDDDTKTDDKAKEYVSERSTEKQESRKIIRDEKRGTSGYGQQLSNKEKFLKGGKQTSNVDRPVAADPCSSQVQVDYSDSPRLKNITDIEMSSSSQVKSERKLSDHIKVDKNEGKINRRKGKPVKRKIASAEETLVTVDRVEKGLELVSQSQTLQTPKTSKSKASGKRKHEIESPENNSAIGIEQESSQNRDSIGNFLTGAEKNEGVTSDLAQHIKNNKKQRLNKNEASKTNKGKGAKMPEKKDSVDQIPEQEHIILKLQIPQSEESAKQKRHHHHHHHHKHKHSANHRDASPKKSHHKKSESKLPKNVGESDGSQSPKTNKKISIKIKGLSSKNIDLEMAAESSELVKSGEVDDERSTAVKSKQLGKETSKAKSDKDTKDVVKKKKKPKLADLSSLQSESEHVKLVIKKDKLPSNSKIVEKKKHVPSTSGQDKTGSQKKNTSSTKSKKGKGSKTPVKSSLTPSKPKVVTSYLLFCKQHRKKIVEENPGLEFTEISKKVGIAWNNLEDEEKQYWRDKAEETRKLLGLASPRDVSAPTSATSNGKAQTKADKTEPIDLAAHLQLLGESLSTIGACLRVQDPGEVHGSLSVMLDSALCAMAPLLFLTTQVPEMDSCSQKMQAETLDNLAYLMPGLG